MERLHAATQEAIRALLVITCLSARGAGCPYCHAPADESCTGTDGLHLARIAAACREGFVSHVAFAAVILSAGPDFAKSTVITPGGAQ